MRNTKRMVWDVTKGTWRSVGPAEARRLERLRAEALAADARAQRLAREER